jgi:hypothetical protein
VLRKDARVDDVRAGALASGLVVDVGGGVDGAVRDARQAPGHVGPGDVRVDGHHGVLLDEVDLFGATFSITAQGRYGEGRERSLYLRQLAHGIQHLRAQWCREALEAAGSVDMFGLS